MREIRVELPPEPDQGSVVLVELTNLAWVGPGVKTERLAFQRLGQERDRQAWQAIGRDPMHGSRSWAELIGLADGRPVLVLWEPEAA